MFPSAVAPPVIRTQPGSVNIDDGGTASFTVVASGEELTYQWFHGETSLTDMSGEIAGATSATLRIFNVQADDIGNYQVRVSNAGGLVNSSIVTLTISELLAVLLYTVLQTHKACSQYDTTCKYRTESKANPTCMGMLTPT